jgi:death on curing protein
VAFVSAVHDEILAASGGRDGILKPDLLESATEQPTASAGGEDAYASLFLKVAAIGRSIAHGHVFNDANKRTAIEVMVNCLRWNGFKRQPNQAAIEVSILLVAAGFLDVHGLRLGLLYAYDQDTTDPNL